MIRRLVLGSVAAGAALLTAAWIIRNPERETLDAEARVGVAGRFVGSSVGTTHFEVAGPDTGRVAVLVHGFSVPYYIWDSTFHALAETGHRVIRYDLMGRGYSDRADQRYDGAMYDAQLGELLDSLGVSGPVDLFGLSFGGFVAAHFAAGHPARVRTLVLVDPTVDRSAGPAFLGWPLIGPYLFQVMAVPTMADGQPGDFLHPERFPGWADRYRPQTHFRGFGRALLRTRGALADADFDAMHRRIAAHGTPVLLVWGRQDRVIPIEEAETLRQRIPRTEFVPIDSAGHLPHLEQAPVFNAAVAAFMQKHPVARVP